MCQERSANISINSQCPNIPYKIYYLLAGFKPLYVVKPFSIKSQRLTLFLFKMKSSFIIFTELVTAVVSSYKANFLP